MNKLIYLTITSLLLITFASCSSSGYSDSRQWKYFGINASTDDDPLFVKLQDELNIEPKMQSYLITVDLRDKDENNHKIIIGELTDMTRIVASWKTLTKETRDKLIKWNGSNKFPL
ncbi:MAG: hypothetical protein ACOYN6_02010 [Ignavibacteria bacterium]